MEVKPVYSFTIPSIHDDTTLDCRMYHPNDLDHLASTRGAANLRCAILGHPYAPLGGSYDDHVVLTVTEILVELGYVVGTFNFRGAGDSQGSTSWTGRAEIDDFASMTGMLVYYVQRLRQEADLDSRSSAWSSTSQPRIRACTAGPMQVILAGYSYGSLILARLPPIANVLERFQEAPIGTGPAEIVMRARTLAKQTLSTFQTQPAPEDRGRTALSAEDAGLDAEKRLRISPVTMGGEETNASSRRVSHDSRRGVEVVRELPKRIFSHIRTGSGSPRLLPQPEEMEPLKTEQALGSQVHTMYLVISPVVIPFTTQLCPPGPPSLAYWTRRAGREDAGSMFLQHPTLAIFGTTDAFTSRARLRAWAEKQAAMATGGNFQWEQVEGADHFWREEETSNELQERIKRWIT